MGVVSEAGVVLDTDVAEAVVEVAGTACQRKGMTYHHLGERAVVAC